MLLNYITWNIDPEIFAIDIPLLGTLSIRWYGLMFALAFYLGYILMNRYYIKAKISEKELDKFSLIIIISTVSGARLGHILFYEPAYYLSHPWNIFKIWEGGLASHGAAIGILSGVWYYSKKYGRKYLGVLDRLVIVVALGGVFIRLGNLMNSEIFGHVTNLPWGFKFVRSWNPVLAESPRHPTQIYEALAYTLIFFILHNYYIKKCNKKPHGRVFGLFLIMLFGVRFLIEFLKEPQVLFEQTMFLNMGQLLSIPFIFTGLYFILRKKKSE